MTGPEQSYTSAMSSRFDGDQRMVGHAIRRRAGLPMSHLAMAEIRNGGRASMSSNLKGVPSDYPTGSGSTGRGSSARNLVKSPDNAAFTEAVMGVMHPELHPPRVRMSLGESSTARLTVSPSMKIPTESPAPTQGAGRTIPSQPGRSRATFDAGAAEEMGH